MPTQRFLSQQQLVTWSDEGKIEVQGDRMTVVAEKVNASIKEAVLFVKLVSGDDVQGLLSKVKTSEQLKALSAEHYLDSVILGETAYEVQQGYITVAAGGAPAAAASAHPAPPAARTNGADADALASFILNKI